MSPTVAVGVVAHPRRRAHARLLADTVNAEVVHWDRSGNGPAAGHRAVWTWLADSQADYGLVVEDDAVPVDGFAEQVTAALASSPSPLTSLYLGRNRPPHWQDPISRVIGTDAHYLVAPELLHGVAYALAGQHIRAMLAATVKAAHFTEGVSDWCRDVGLAVAYTNPSLVDHNHLLQTLVAEQPTRYDETAPGSVSRDFAPSGWERRAWRVGTRPDWTGSSVLPIPTPTDVDYPLRERS